MPLDTTSYPLAHLRLDGRRWNELRRIHGQISTQPSSCDGSSYFELGNTKVLCTVTGPEESRSGGGGGGGGGRDNKEASVVVDVNLAGFSGVERRRRGRGDKRISEMQHTIASTFQATLSTALFPRSSVNVVLHVLCQDGSLLAACLNAATLALVDAGIPMVDYVAACTAGTSSSSDEDGDPILDLNGQEEQELPFLTVGTLGGGEKVSVLVMETRVRVERVEGMLDVGVRGCSEVKRLLDQVVRERGRRILEGEG